MTELARPVGLGLAARGDVRDVVSWAARAEDVGLESLWVHDSYFERDPISFLAPTAAATRRIGLGAGALNPYTRHPFVVASTLASLDNLAPGRMSLALGSGLPLRLQQMNIEHAGAPERVSEAIDQVRELWQGRRLVLNTEVPPLVPMFPPPQRIPIYIAAYTRRYLEIAGEKADGYLARPMESIPAFEVMRERVLDSARRHGRPPQDITFRGYLLCMLGDSRADALNRAKRDPFVIYMVSILSDISVQRAGFPAELRDRVRSLWREERYHEAAQAIPDDLLDAFLLVGTTEQVAGRASEYRAAGMDVPLLQPVVQDEDQVRRTLDACLVYGGAAASGVRGWPRAGSTAESPGVALSGRPSLRAAVGGVVEIMRPFSFSASIVPVATAGAVAWAQGKIQLVPWLAALIAAVALHAGTNVINEIYDVRHGIDSITSPRASHAIVRGGISERGAFVEAYALFAVAAVLGLYLVWLRGPLMLALGLLGLAGGYFYTAPPFQYKYRALGIPLVFILMGVLMTVGGYFAATASLDWRIVAISVPAGLLVAAILHGNEWRDIAEDTRLGFTTFSGIAGRTAAYRAYAGLVIGAYVALAVAVMAGFLPSAALLAMFSLPAAWWVLRHAERGFIGSVGDINMIDLMTARVHATFGVLLIFGIVASRLLAP